MPIYEYICKKCQTEYVKVRSIRENDPGYDCEKCNISLVRKYDSIVSVFNGDGFYSTDKRKK
jgi:putative FmdB family regulatory protein